MTTATSRSAASLYIRKRGSLGRLTMGKTSIATDDLVYTYLALVRPCVGDFNVGVRSAV